MSRTVFKLLSLWSFAALLLLLGLQVLPSTGPGLEDLGASVAAGWLVNIALVCLFFEALTNRLPRVVIALPLIVYGGYASAYWRQGAHVEERSRQLKATNPAKILAFDPQLYSLVMDRAADFVATHAIPVVYARDFSYRPEPYQSYRLAGVEQAAHAAKEATTEIQVFAVYLDDAKIESLRELRIAERPANRIVSVATRTDPGAGWADWNIGAEITEISLDGKSIGTFKSGFVWRLPAFPRLAIGCRFAAGGGRKCYADLAFARQPIDSMPAFVDPSQFDDPVSVMLGLRKLTERELSAGQGFDLTLASPETTRVAASRDKQAAFVALQAVLNGQRPDAPASVIAEALVHDPDRLGPLASAIAGKLAELNQPERVGDPGQREPASILAVAAASLPAADFARVSDSLRDVVRRSGAWAEYPELYLRLADAGPGMFSFYRDRFLAPDTPRTERLLAALAICRIGQADGELTAALKAQFSANDPADPHLAEFSTAMFVALFKLGQTDFLEGNAHSDSAQLQGWYDALLAGKGETPIGPNNCLSWDWPWPQSLAPVLAPSLSWIHGRWEAEAGK